jgi:hypothetical protein
LKKPITKKGLVEWLKVEALSSNPRPAKKKRHIRRGLLLGPAHPQALGAQFFHFILFYLNKLSCFSCPSPQKKKTCKEGQAWWYMPVIPGTWEAVIGSFKTGPGPGKSTRSCLKNKLKSKSTGGGSCSKAFG